MRIQQVDLPYKLLHKSGLDFESIGKYISYTFNLLHVQPLKMRSAKT